ncbi:MAG: hypothetical protein K1Y02_24100, partial [Candidatus Hydrogenedentes bacterium]|nr:hypothetical protein [Candidatus Hydrogenedentota bacterium]
MQHPENASKPNAVSADPANPYNIDFEKERRSKRMFVILIATGFVLAAILLILGFVLDHVANPPVPASTPVIQQPAPQSLHPPVESGQTSASE